MTTPIAPNVAGVATASPHSVFSMCGMCATRCPIGWT